MANPGIAFRTHEKVFDSRYEAISWICKNQLGRRNFREEEAITGAILFADFMEQWLAVVKNSVAVTTYSSYSNIVKRVIVPYFKERKITLQELTAKDIQDFCLKELERVSASSVIHYHANIHKALKYAVKHTVACINIDGEKRIVAADRTKNKSSMRTLPLVPFVKERLLQLQEEQKENRRLCGRSYIKDYTGYVCVNEIGDLIKPNYVSEQFPKLLEKYGCAE